MAGDDSRRFPPRGAGHDSGINPLREIARRLPAPLDGVTEVGAGLLDEATHLLDGRLSGKDLDQWDPEYIERTLPVMSLLFGTYFRGEVRGLANIPAEGPALLVGNHSGGLMIADSFVFSIGFYEHFGPRRRFHQLAHDLAARLPGMGLIRYYGTVAASHDNARRAFELGAPVLVYPGGDYETFRPSWHSSDIEFGGRKGFIRLALEQGVPIVPVVAIGGQETALFLTRGQRVARALRLDQLTRIKVFPIALGPPFGVNVLDLPGRLPLPAKITVEVLPPIDLEDRFGPDPEPERVYDDVTEEMQAALDMLSDEREAPLLG
jgi:1-acyl-sn-glycerol-3-phosphate acyltransferase